MIACLTFVSCSSTEPDVTLDEAPNAEILSNDSISTNPTIETSASSLPTLPGLDAQRFDKVIHDVAMREDPTLDGWSTERFNELAGAQLKLIGKLLSHPETIDPEHVAAVCSTSFEAPAIRPPYQTAVFEDKSLSVYRANELSDRYESVSGIDGLVAALKHQSEPLAGLRDIRSKFKIVRVTPNGDSNDTTAYFQVSGRNESKAVQINAIWNCTWEGDSNSNTDEPTPKITRIDVETYEEIIYKKPGGSMFGDCTESVFANSDRFNRQLRNGIDYWTDRFDGAIARPAAGHGIAIGDVNGDGLDDVYLCQPPGLPNLLLIQNVDGTVTDTAVEADVHWLEGTRAALLADLDNDGDQDLVAVLGNKTVIMANDGTGKFKLKSVVDAASSLFAINAVDYDNDGDLDLYICGYTLTADLNQSDVFANPMPFHDAENGAPM